MIVNINQPNSYCDVLCTERIYRMRTLITKNFLKMWKSKLLVFQKDLTVI